VEKDKVSFLPFGLWGEDLAAEYLENKGYKVIERHFFFHHTEIDLVARDGNYLVFVEVKTRSSQYFGPPEEAITERKKGYLRRAAEGYLYLNNLNSLDCRFDVISICYRSDGPPEIEHFENAFE
jgi:putative endonuclease